MVHHWSRRHLRLLLLLTCITPCHLGTLNQTPSPKPSSALTDLYVSPPSDLLLLLRTSFKSEFDLPLQSLNSGNILLPLLLLSNRVLLPLILLVLVP